VSYKILIMKNLLEQLPYIDSFVISGCRQSGKLSLALFFSSKLTSRPVTLISASNKEYYNKKETAFLALKTNLQPVLENIRAFNLKLDWKTLKSRYGFNYLLKDIEKIIDKSNDVVIFHRIDDFFEIQDSDDIDAVISKIISLSNAKGLKVLFTINMGNERSRYIYEYFERNIDAEFLISKRTSSSNVRDVELISSHVSVRYSYYSFSLNKVTNNFEVNPIRKAGLEVSQKQVYQVVLASSSPDLISIIRYLFESDIFQVKYIKPALIDMMSEIAGESDVILFNPPSGQSLSETNKVSRLVSSSNKKVILISSQSRLRYQDKADLLRKGFNDIFDGLFNIEEFIFSIEEAIGHPFYNNKIQNLPDKKLVLKDIVHFSRFIAAYLQSNVFFTIFKFEYKSTISEGRLKEMLGRTYDIACFNKNEKTIFLCLINTLSRDSKHIESKIKKICPTIELIGNKDSSQYSRGYIHLGQTNDLDSQEGRKAAIK